MRRKATLLTGLLAMLALAGPATAQFEKRPGSGQPLEAPHPAYTIEQARPNDFNPQTGALCFLPNGKLAITTFPPANNGKLLEKPNGSLYIIDNPTAKDPAEMKVKLIADDLFNPLGMNYVDGALYVCVRDEVIKWTDTDNDGYPDKRESFASGWISDNYHHFTFGLPYIDGNFYITLSTNIILPHARKDENIQGEIVALNGPNPADRGCLLKINGKTGEYETVVGGLRTPNGVSLGPEGHIIMPDNQGAWKPASCIYFDKQGAFFGHYNNTTATSDFYPDGGVPSAFSDQPITPPAVWIPQNECANSPGSMVEIPEGHPHAGQYLMAEITKGGIRRVQFEKIDDTWQGEIYRHSHGFEAGTNRLVWGPDGCLYVGCMGAGGNWAWKNTKTGLQRLAPTGKTAFEFASINATKDGFKVTFTKPVAKADLENLEGWAINEWTYKQDPEYGGPKINDKRVKPTKAVASKDGLSVELTLPDRKANYIYYIRTNPKSTDGELMWSNEAWYTFHKAPAK